jgi:hypothetical protein
MLINDASLLQASSDGVQASPVLHFKSLAADQIDTAAMIVMRLCKEGFRTKSFSAFQA